MKLWEYAYKNVRLVLNNGTIIIGKVEEWLDGEDIDGVDEIVIGSQSYPESDIKKIEVINN